MDRSFREEAGTIVRVPRREDDLRYRAGRRAGMRRGHSPSARRPPGVHSPFETLESRLLLSASPAIVEPTPFALSIPLASLIMIEAPNQDALALDSTLSLPPFSPSASIAPTAKGGALLAMLDSVATQQGTAPGGMMTVLDASADDVGRGGSAAVPGDGGIGRRVSHRDRARA